MAGVGYPEAYMNHTTLVMTVMICYEDNGIITVA